MTITIADIANEPDTEPVASMKIPIKGYPVASATAPPKSGLVQNSIAIRIPNPRQPFIPTLSIRARGITFAAFTTSSAIYQKLC
jgi:hypothetical protein